MDIKDVAEDLRDTENMEQLAETGETDEPEKTLPVSRVNELVKKAKHKGERKMQNELEALRSELAEIKNAQGQGQTGMGGMSVNTDEIRQQVIDQVTQDLMKQQEADRQKLIEQEALQVANQFHGKMQQGKERYDDFEDVIAGFNPGEFPSLVILANEADNTADVMYELKKNPTKLAALASLVERSPTLARSEIAKLSNSIKKNQEAIAQEQNTTEPLDRMKPSTVGVDNGSRSIRDLRSQPSLRG